MATLISKYNLGDKVFSPHTENKPYYVDCESCSATGRLKIEGKDIYVNCTTCGDAYRKGSGKITKLTYKPVVENLTVGQIRVKMDLDEYEVQYMCEETGIGSGTLHYENCLFDTEAEAMKVAIGMSTKSNETGHQVYLKDYISCKV